MMMMINTLLALHALHWIVFLTCLDMAILVWEHGPGVFLAGLDIYKARVSVVVVQPF